MMVRARNVIRLLIVIIVATRCGTNPHYVKMTDSERRSPNCVAWDGLFCRKCTRKIAVDHVKGKATPLTSLTCDAMGTQKSVKVTFEGLLDRETGLTGTANLVTTIELRANQDVRDFMENKSLRYPTVKYPLDSQADKNGEVIALLTLKRCNPNTSDKCQISGILRIESD
jgi:hypothetical protein